MTNVTPVGFARNDLGRLAEEIHECIMEHTDRLTVTEVVGVLEMVKFMVIAEQQE